MGCALVVAAEYLHKNPPYLPPNCALLLKNFANFYFPIVEYFQDDLV